MPGLRTLDKYILGKFLRTYIFGILMMIIILVVFDYVEKVDDFTELKAPMKEIIWDYYMNFIPQFVSQFSALFTFIAVIFFTSKMAMQTEIVAILSGGVSFRRFMWPYIVGATLITAMSLVLSLWIIPEGQKASVEFQSKYLKSQQLVEYDDHVYRQIEDGTYAYVRGFSPGMERVPFFAIERFEGAELVETLDAANATFDVESQRWTAPRYMIYSRGEGHADNREDECRDGVREACMALHLDKEYLIRALAALLREEVVELLVCEGLNHTRYIAQLADIEVDEGVEVAILLTAERTILATRIYHIAGCCPALRLHIECGICSIERLDKLCALEALNGEEGHTLHAWREATHIGICAVLNLAIYMVVIFHQLLTLEILALELYARLLALGDNPQAKHKAHRRN